jgi:branched-chain amino acid transport system ATP-binding protein
MITSTAQKYRPLLIATTAVIALPFALAAMGLSHNTGTTIVALAVAAMGLNLCIGYTGLVSFGHGAWFPGQIWLPLLLSTIVVAAASAFVGAVILRRRGVYFSLLTLALAADLHHRLSLDDTHRRRGRPRRAQARQLRWLQPR